MSPGPRKWRVTGSQSPDNDSRPSRVTPFLIPPRLEEYGRPPRPLMPLHLRQPLCPHSRPSLSAARKLYVTAEHAEIAERTTSQKESLGSRRPLRWIPCFSLFRVPQREYEGRLRRAVCPSWACRWRAASTGKWPGRWIEFPRGPCEGRNREWSVQRSEGRDPASLPRWLD